MAGFVGIRTLLSQIAPRLATSRQLEMDRVRSCRTELSWFKFSRRRAPLSTSMKQRLQELEREKRALLASLAEPADPSAVPVDPNLADACRRGVSERDSLPVDPELRDEAMEAICGMIERIVVAPRDGGGVDLERHGDLARILALCRAQTQNPAADATGFCCDLVAGARNHRYRHTLAVAI